MSYHMGRDGRLQEQVHFVGMAGRSRTRSTSGRRRISGMGGIFGGTSSLGSVGGGPATPFDEAVEAASDALVDLAERAATVQRTTFSVQQKEVARQVLRFATETGAAKLVRVTTNRDLAGLNDLQRSVDSMMSISLSEGIVSDIANRFLRMTILPPSVMTAEDAERLKEIARNPVPGFPPPGKTPVIVYVGVAIAGVIGVGYFINGLANLTD